MNIARVVSILLFIIVYAECQAQRRSLAQAKLIAREYLQQTGLSQNRVAVLTSPTSTDESHTILNDGSMGDNPYYIFHDSLSEKTLIVSGDNRMKTILGVCNKGYDGINNIPCGLKTLFSYYTEQYYSLADTVFPEDYASQEAFSANDIPPLISSTWYQNSPYNDNCPAGCPSGCVATAMAQIMRYWKYPESGKGQHTYTSMTNHYLMSYDFEHATFDWENMANSYSEFPSAETAVSRSAVANILKACGVSVGMDYNHTGSGAYDTSIAYALTNFFKYNKNVALYERTFFKTSDWYAKVLEELVNKRPVLYCGVDRTGNQASGHAFIVDGYRQFDGMFHVNWGWGGRYDGYFVLDALQSPNGRYSASQSMITKFCPNEVGVHEDTFYADEFICQGDVEFDKPIKTTLIGVENHSSSSSYVVPNTYFKGVIGIGLFDKDFQLVRSLATTVIKKTTYGGEKRVSYDFSISSNGLQENQVYYLAPYAKSDNMDTPTLIRTVNGKTDYYIINDGSGQGGNVSPIEKETILTEHFESPQLPNGWSQEAVIGVGRWNGKLVLKGDDTSSTPNPASGNGYVYMNYNSGTFLSNIRSVSRLISPSLSGKRQQDYQLSFQSRKHSSNYGTTEIIAILIDHGCKGEWTTLSEHTITNQDIWMGINIPYTAEGTYRLAIEGSLEYGGSLFIDDVKVVRIDESVNVETVTLDNDNNIGITHLYNLLGYKSIKPYKGVSIIRKPNGNIVKVLTK